MMMIMMNQKLDQSPKRNILKTKTKSENKYREGDEEEGPREISSKLNIVKTMTKSKKK
jgi:hypothetical protein